MAWRSGTTTPALKWNDGAALATTLHVRPFPVGAASITVEVRTERNTWVDFTYVPPPPEAGTFAAPYNTLEEGVTFAPWDGAVYFKPGATSERRTIDKALTLLAPFGPITLGQ
jgi:hypothetical protein